MSNINKLVKQTDLFERLAVFGDRSSFLKSLAQNPGNEVNDQDLLFAAQKVSNEIQNWIANYGQKVPDVGGGLIKGLPKSLWNASEVVRAYTMHRGSFNVNDLDKLNKATLQLSAVVTFADMEAEGKNAWFDQVFPSVNNLMSLVEKQKQYLASFPAPEAEENVSQVATNTAPVASQKLSGPALSAFFQKAYKAVKSGQSLNVEDLATWNANSAAFKGRSAKLNNDIKNYGDNPYQNEKEMNNWKAEKSAIDLVVSKLG